VLNIDILEGTELFQTCVCLLCTNG